MSDTVVSMRLNEEEIEAIDQFIKNGDFGTRTEFIRFAIRKTLMHYDGRVGFKLPEDKE